MRGLNPGNRQAAKGAKKTLNVFLRGLRGCAVTALAWLLVACGSATYMPPLTPASPEPTATVAIAAPEPSATLPSVVAPTATRTPRPSATARPTRVIPPTPCTTAACAESVNHFWLARPFPPISTVVNYIDSSYRYGSTQGGLREPHHGVEFFNPQGTTIHAAAAGTVVVAGQDDVTVYGRVPNFYGNLVVVELAEKYNGQPVYNLYGHLLDIVVQVGDAVQPGTVLGSVGQTGVAIGAHLHFEVRVGTNTYTATHNPELWFIPLPQDNQPQGVVAGRVVDTAGNLVPEVTIVLRPVQVDADYIRNFYFTTYAQEVDSINGDEVLQENFALTDVPPGLYTISVNTTKFYQQTIEVKAGKIAWATFLVEPLPPTPLPTHTAAPTLVPTIGPSETPGGELTLTPETTAPPDSTPAPTVQGIPTP